MTTDYTPREVSELLDARRDPADRRARGATSTRAAGSPGRGTSRWRELAAQAETIDRDRPVVFYCRSGARSAMATEAFRGAGFDAHNMAGGLLDWDATGLPLEPEGGYVASTDARRSATARVADYHFHLIEQPTGLVSGAAGSSPARTASSAARSHSARRAGSS